MPSESQQFATSERGLFVQMDRARLFAGLFLLLGFLLWNLISANSQKNFELVLIACGYTVFAGTIILLKSRYESFTPSFSRFSYAFDVIVLSLFLLEGGKLTSPLAVTYFLLLLTSGLANNTQKFRQDAITTVVAFGATLLFSSFWHSQIYLGAGILLGLLLETFLLYQTLHNESKTESSSSAQVDPLLTEQDISDRTSKNEQQLLLISNDSSDRHMLLSYISSWDMNIKVCTSTIRAFTELLEAVKEGRTYTTVLVDSLNLDFEPVQFALALKSEPSLSDLDLIHVSPGQDKEMESRLIKAGYSKALTTPLDKTILFDALHESKIKPHKAENVTHLIHHYSRKDTHRRPNDILLATSNLIEQKRLRNILEADGQRVYVVSNGAQALDAMNTHQFDLIVIDFILPDIKGNDVISLYSYTYMNHERIPFVALVEEPTPETLSKCREAKVDAALVKPIEENRLLATVADLTSAHLKQTDLFDNHNNYIQDNSACSTKDSGQILNTHTLLQLDLLSDGNDFLNQLINRFNEDINQLLEEMENSIKQNKFAQFKDISHAMRDSSCNIGAELMHKICLQALHFNQKEFQKKSQSLLEEIQTAHLKTRHALQNYVIQRNNPASEKE